MSGLQMKMVIAVLCRIVEQLFAERSNHLKYCLVFGALEVVAVL